MIETQTSRRDFLKTSSTSAGGLMLAMSLPVVAGKSMAAGTVHTPNAWVHIGDDNSITLLNAHSEMGQGVYTSMSMLVAEELNVDLDQVNVVSAPPAAVYVNALLGAQITGGSTSVRDGWEKLRVAGAQVREMLFSAAAAKWGVDKSQLTSSRGIVSGPGGKTATYGELADAASKLPVPEKVALKDPKDFRLVGTRAPRVDLMIKTNGTAQFGIDATLPGMVYAALAQCPVIGGTPVSFDDSKAKAMPGVIAVVKIADGVAVVADTWWRAKKAKDTLTVTWDRGAGANISDDSAFAGTRKAIASGKVIEITKPVGNVDEAMKGAAKTMQAEYVQYWQSHSPLEPMNFTADVKGDKVTLVGPTQFQQGAQGSVAAALGVKPEDITLKTTYLGGGFGRRIELDFIVQAAQISKSVGKPVKLVWSREDDMTHDFYRPLAVNQMKGAMDKSGMPVALEFKVGSQSVTQRAFGLPKDTLDPFMVEAAVPGYNIPNAKFDLMIHDTGVRVGYMRAVSHNHNAFANESFIDEMAKAAGKDPYAYRMALLQNSPRHANVLKLAAEKAGWGKPLPAGRAHGIALMDGYDTYMAQVAEVSVTNGVVRVHKVTVAVDAGMLINPDTVEAQVQGAIILGMGPALKNRIHIKNGEVQEQNFNTYEPIRAYEAPHVDVILVKSSEKPGGIGEPATAVVGPAIANAVAALTGKRVRSLPITAEVLSKA